MTTATLPELAPSSPADLRPITLAAADRWRLHLRSQRTHGETPLAVAVASDGPAAPEPTGNAPDGPSEAPAAPERGLVLDHETFDVTRHDGMVTIFNKATGGHRTFSIQSQPKDATFAPGRRIVSLLIGPDRENWEHWKRFAFADDFGVHVWRKHQGSEFEILAKMLENPRRFAARGCKYLAEVACRRCGRPLSRPESISSGYGPTCLGKI